MDILSDESRKKAPLTITQSRNQVQITMYDQTHTMLNELSPDMDGVAIIPAAMPKYF